MMKLETETPLARDALDLRRRLSHDGWLGHRTAPPLTALALSPALAPVPDEEWRRFFEARGITAADDADLGEGPGQDPASTLDALDRDALAHGLSLLCSEGAQECALGLLPPEAAPALAGERPLLDHVGIELLGRLEWSIAALAEWAARLGLDARGCHVFPSVQVRRALADDPDLRDVRIARVFFVREGRTVNLELFEVGQHWRRAVARRVALLADIPGRDPARLSRALLGRAAPRVEPIGHLALRVADARAVEAVHAAVAGARRGDALRVYEARPSYNPADRSVNTKLVCRSAIVAGEPVHGRVLELIHYARPEEGARPAGV